MGSKPITDFVDRIICGDCLDILRTMPDAVVQTCITSPPYWGLRDYQTATWKGGDPKCAHTKRTSAKVASSTLVGSKNTQNHEKEGLLGDICGKCGAKRIDQQIGLELTPEEYVAKMVEVFREVWRVLKDDGTLWLNLGDSYAGSSGDSGNRPERSGINQGQRERNTKHFTRSGYPTGDTPATIAALKCSSMDLKPKDLVGIPWMVAFALRADGWYLRSEIIWSKPNPMPESVTDRPATSHEKIFLLTKSGDPIFWTHPKRRAVRKKPKPDYRWRHKYTGLETNYQPVSSQMIKAFWKRTNQWTGHDYYYDADAIAEPASSETTKMPDGWDTEPGAHGTIHREGRARGKPTIARRDSFRRSGPVANHVLPGQDAPQHRDDREDRPPSGMRNKRSVWTVATQPFKKAHFATFPEKLIEPCILAGTSERGQCPDCGKPWVRVASVEDPNQRLGKAYHNHENDLERGQRSVPPGNGAPIKKTLGWYPSCKCGAEPVPQIVLDPFFGVGTVGKRSKELGRHWIGIDLNPEYCKLAAEYTAQKELFL